MLRATIMPHPGIQMQIGIESVYWGGEIIKTSFGGGGLPPVIGLK